MNEKATSALQKAQQERKRGQFPRAVKRLEQAIASFPDELDLYFEAIDTCLDGGEVMQATNLVKTVQERFTRERDRVSQFVRERLQAVHDPSLARCVVENAVKRRDLEGAMALLDDVAEHTVRDLSNRARTKLQSLNSATHGGHTLRGEMLTNELTNALLSIRLGNLKEATATLARIVEEKPVEQRMLDPFLAAMEVRHAKSGRIRFARGCSLRAGGDEVDAVARFVEAARLEPACAAVCAEQLKAMREHARQPERVQHALGQVLLLKGDLDEAAATLREYLAGSPDRAREVVMMLRPYLDPSQGLTACTWLAVEAAMKVEQSAVALEILRPLQQRGGHGPALFEWLEARAAEGFLPPDIMLFHGTLALEEKNFDRASEILGAVCATSAGSVHAVLALVDRHRASHPALEELYRSHATPEEDASESAREEDVADFQMFENKEFHLETMDTPGQDAPRGSKDGAKPRSAKESSIEKPATGPKPSPARPALPKKSLMDARELSFEDEEEPAATEPEPGFELTESHLSGVAQRLYEAGAAAFFHIDGDDTGAHAPAVDAQDEPAPETREDAPAPAPTPAPEPAMPAPFDAEFARFTRGEMDNRGVLALLERAVDEGRVDELHELIYFEPETSAEHLARYFYQAEYHRMCNRPLQALEILARLDTPDLDEDGRRRVWYRIAVCQRLSHNFDGADATLQRLVENFPGHDEFARLRRLNHEQMLEWQAQEAPVLEKTSAL